MKLLMNKRVYLHQHRLRCLPVFCLCHHFLLRICHFSFIKCKPEYFLIHLKSKFKSNSCTFQSKQCYCMHAPSHEKLIFGLVKKWLNIDFPKTKQGAQQRLKPLRNVITKDFSLHWVSLGVLQSRLTNIVHLWFSSSLWLLTLM